MTRIQLEVNDLGLKDIEELMLKTGTTTKKDLLNDALTLFEWAVKEVSSGRIIASVDENNKVYREVMMTSLERVSKVRVP